MLISFKELISIMDRFQAEKKPFLFVIDFEKKKPMFFDIESLKSEGILFKAGQEGNIIPENGKKDVRIVKHPVSFSRYKEAFDLVMENLNYGNTYLLNLTFPTKIEVNLSMNEIYHASRARYKMLVPGRFVFFSPEPFIRIEKDAIYSYPMKGTIDADLPDAGELLLNDKKELAEHITITDLIRNDLSIVAKKVRVNRFRYLETIRTSERHLLQTSSEISGILREEFRQSFGRILEKMLPAGSVSGAPKEKTTEIIRSAEGIDRGYYTGVAGFYDGSVLDTCVVIRYIESKNNELFYRSGGGITVNSDAEKEYREMTDKVYVPSY